jgi:aspartyl-tRNA(Asn)/glutamyl-tRNA(Gln) amidotransferase subunit A
VPDIDELVHLYRTIASAEAVAVHHERMAAAPELFEPETAQRLQAAAEVPAYVYARALRRLAALRSTAADRFAGLDLLLHPTVPVLAPPIGARDTAIGGGWTSPRDALLSLTMPWSVLALPALSIPIPSPGLPVGAQLVAAPGSDARLLATARTIERLCV